MINYPATVSRTLDPSGRGLRTVLGQYDKHLSDADINLIQDLQDWKRQLLLGATAPSGCLTRSPFQFTGAAPNTLYLPAFKVLFRGEVVQVQGYQSPTLRSNRITLPAPSSGLAPGRLYVVFLELWYAGVDPLSGQGYYQDPGGQRYFYPYGCVGAVAPQLTQFPDDVIDPGFAQVTTERVQLQWRIGVQPIPLGYDFSAHRYGLDPDPVAGSQVFGQGGNPGLTTQGFVPLASVTGEATLWRAGGDPLNSVASLDGYSYALPLAVVFQRTLNAYDPDLAPFGCAGSTGGGTVRSNLSGRFDARFADLVYPDDLVDTRLSTSLTGYTSGDLLSDGLSSVLSGSGRAALTRSSHPAGAVGSLLNQLIGLAPAATQASWQNIQPVGSFDGFRNGLSADQRTYLTAVQVAPPNRHPLWTPGDVITLGFPAITAPASVAAGASGLSASGPIYPGSSYAWSIQGGTLTSGTGTNQVGFTAGPEGYVRLDCTLTNPGAVVLAPVAQVQVAIGPAPVLPAPEPPLITSVFTQYLNGANLVAPLMGNQISIVGVGSSTVQLTPAAYPPAGRPLLITVGATYPSASGVDLQQVPSGPVYGQLTDPAAGMSGTTTPVFGVSGYALDMLVPAMQAATTQVRAYSPGYSSSIFGLRVHLTLPNAQATPGAVADTVVFNLPRTGLDGRFFGLYVTRALDQYGVAIPVLARDLTGANLLVTLQGPLAAGGSTELVILCHRTSQAAINPAVLGAVALEETILLGGGNTSSWSATPLLDLAYALDRRASLVTSYLPGFGTTITGLLSGGRLQGIAGNDSGDQTALLWAQPGNTQQFVPTPCSIAISAAAFTLTVPGTDLTNTPWFVVASFFPGLTPASSLVLSSSYVPYQGEGIPGRDYRVLATAPDALVTTNGTGAAPVPGVQDVFGFDRQLPVATTLPALGHWSDSDLANQALGGADDNYTAKRASNVEASFTTPLRSNDFVPPLQGSVHRVLQLAAPSGRGFAQIQPHVGFAIKPPISQSELGLSYATVAPVTLYVDNVNGRFGNSGLSPEAPLPTVASALSLLPPLLLHPVSVLLQGNAGRNYRMADLARGDFMYSDAEGGIYCLGLVSFTMQGAGCLTFGCTQSGLGIAPVVIDGSGSGVSPDINDAAWFGASAQFAAFVITSGHVVFSGIGFTATGSLPAFWAPPSAASFGAVRVERAEVEFQDCSLVHPSLGVTAWSGADLSWTGGTITLGPGEVGLLGSGCSLQVTGPSLVIDGDTQHSSTEVFFAVSSGGSLTLSQDDGRTEGLVTLPPQPNPTQETGFPETAPWPTVAQANLGSTIIASWSTPSQNFTTQGQAVLNGQSVLQLQGISHASAQANPTQASLIALQDQFSAIVADASSVVVGAFA